jgi:tRNA(His) 5'-end guanylyltransferase
MLRVHPKRSLVKLVHVIETLIHKIEPQAIKGLDHYLPPHLPKALWNELGDLLRRGENENIPNIPGERWISLRLDGSNFSHTIQILRQKGILEDTRFSDTFATCMRHCTLALMEALRGKLGYTQSDEMIILIPPASVVRGEQQGHHRAGRTTKLITLAASLVTAKFNMLLARICVDRGHPELLEHLLQISPHFDCRLASYLTFQEAQGMVLWRAYDCSMNGVSDAVYQTPGAGEIKNKGSREKLVWLHAQNRLPLPSHQAYGTLYNRVKVAKDSLDPRTQTPVRVLRSRLVPAPPGLHVHHILRTTGLLLTDDTK